MAVNGQNLLSSALDLPKSMWKRLRNKRSNMTSKDYRDFAVEQMGLLEGICTKPMMGEFLLYWQGKYFGGIYDNRVLVKKTKTNERFGCRRRFLTRGPRRCIKSTSTTGRKWRRSSRLPARD